MAVPTTRYAERPGDRTPVRLRCQVEDIVSKIAGRRHPVRRRPGWHRSATATGMPAATPTAIAQVTR